MKYGEVKQVQKAKSHTVKILSEDGKGSFLSSVV